MPSTLPQPATASTARCTGASMSPEPTTRHTGAGVTLQRRAQRFGRVLDRLCHMADLDAAEYPALEQSRDDLTDLLDEYQDLRDLAVRGSVLAEELERRIGSVRCRIGHVREEMARRDREESLGLVAGRMPTAFERAGDALTKKGRRCNADPQHPRTYLL